MAPIVQATEAGVRGFANAVKRLAVADKAFAEELVYMHGIRSEITPNALKQITKDMYDKSGKLTEKGQQKVQRLITEHNLPQNATWDEILMAVKTRKDAMRAAISAKVAAPGKFVSKVSAEVKKSFDAIKKNYPDIKGYFEKMGTPFKLPKPTEEAPNKLFSKSVNLDIYNKNNKLT